MLQKEYTLFSVSVKQDTHEICDEKNIQKKTYITVNNSE